MPELPEVEIIRLQLDFVLKGLKITGVEVLKAKSFQGNPADVIGRKVIKVFRRAKITIIELEGGVYLAIHLKLTGQLIYRVKEPAFAFGYGGAERESERVKEENNGPFSVGQLPNKFTRVVISFDNGGKPCLPAGRLFFNDLRIFGWVRVLKDLRELGEEKFGPEANDEKTFSLEYFQKILAKSSKPVKLIIMDQEKLAGVGNIYANEVLFTAGILPARKANTLNKEEIKGLRNSILSVLKKAVEYKGTSDKDEAFRQINGEKGGFQKFLQVYGRAGQKCPVCGGAIKRIALGGRGTFYCPNCQN